ncbi:MAG: PQQ-like beta-propeller repeat protein [Planctomycetaceae bacterium]|mgnify:CR=1 FL=1|jgi:outer membrane protein assembly factor BamB|nr:PQQ-like beta-propeller repeat protein [Planctomycetaceae bacterium]MBT4012051.1 PQQ-like beta-propeller repeat protein [Planctomycetaceae bacterium]MBT4726037.1 PQQ-like beta-propeller repeat protein [Planctomycetaceae bacterium]MBT4844220.1 PQQ-like beta-propeller repeat protein [Planctomycetaceae bacterium]MBT5124162.1 PQQ-like beta-propeller repeat protein [Planctomycetaceae bacterium]
MTRLLFGLLIIGSFFVAVQTSPVSAQPTNNVLRFRGTDGSGSSTNVDIPTKWSAQSNLKWKAEMPGAGSSTPIVVGDRVYVTCYSGYGTDLNSTGTQKSLARHLIALDLNTGKEIWTASVANTSTEDQFQGFLTEHGYATSTPTSDGENIYAFFGKSGVFAFDKQGKQLWKTSVGTESGSRHWGSSASLIRYKNLIIVNAADESQTIYGLNRQTGAVVWKAEAAGLENTFCTPLLIPIGDRTELVIAVPWEIWGLDPETGKLLWYVETDLDSNVCPSVVAKDGIVYAMGGRQGGSIAVRAGGKGDVAKSHVLWKGTATSYVPSPVIHKDRLYWVNDRGIALCVNAKTGDLVYQERVGASGTGRLFYASVSLINEKLYAVSRHGGTVIYETGDKFTQTTINKHLDDTAFNASPVITGNHLLLRSNSHIYCISQ